EGGAVDRLHVAGRQVQRDVMAPREAGEVQGRVLSELDEVVVPAEETAGVLDARLGADAVGRLEEVVARVEGVQRQDARGRRGGALRPEGDGGGDEGDVLEGVGDVEPREGPQEAPEVHRSPLSLAPVSRVDRLPPEERKAERPGPPEEPGLGEVQRVAAAPLPRLQEGGEDLAAAAAVAGGIGPLEEAAVQPRHAAPDLDLV